MLESITAFDAIAVAVIVISAIMAFARGFLREVATLGAFIGALAAAYYARKFFRDDLASLVPEGMEPWTADLFLVIVAFIIVYVIVAWLGQRLSKNIQGADGIGMFDHIAGLFFGIARGFIALVFFAVLLNLALDDSRIPDWIQNSATYPALSNMASYVNDEASKVGKDVQAALPSEAKTGQ
ncbi:MAG: CvpA family protein [Hyphomonas sp.]|nr:CvpA family protein [Hyphomonas sp.]|tara:strand:- start:1172 stop:1717 length:546 start_codon:yes stop_codon:yes gene_type:complete